MLTLKLKEVLAQNGKLEPTRWLTRICGLTKAKANNLLNHKQKSIAFEDLSTLCEYMQCTPNDLFYWKAKPGHPLIATHPLLTELTPPPDIEGWKQLFKHLTDAQIRELYMKGVEVVEGQKNKSNP